MLDLFLPAVKVPCCGIVEVPGSKSIAIRVLLVAALSRGPSTIFNVAADAVDVQLMLGALQDLGVVIECIAPSTYKIIGCDGIFPIQNIEVFCGNSGLCMRFLLTVLALQNEHYSLTGSERMKQRPIGDLVDALLSIGCNINYVDNRNFPPLQSNGIQNSFTNYICVNGTKSSQYLSALLLASVLFRNSVVIEVIDNLISKPYLDITLSVLKSFGLTINNVNYQRYEVPYIQNLSATNYVIEPDASAASYFFAIGALSGDVTVKGLFVDSIQGDKGFVRVLAQMGAGVEYTSVGTRVHKKDILQAVEVNMRDMPDAAMTLAALALFAQGTTVIHGLSSWRDKETDRLTAMYNELSRLGATVFIDHDSIKITPPDKLIESVIINTYDDHRMAMAFSLVAAGGVSVTIKDSHCVTKTFAKYFTVFTQLCYTKNEIGV